MVLYFLFQIPLFCCWYIRLAIGFCISTLYLATLPKSLISSRFLFCFFLFGQFFWISYIDHHIIYKDNFMSFFPNLYFSCLIVLVVTFSTNFKGMVKGDMLALYLILVTKLLISHHYVWSTFFVDSFYLIERPLFLVYWDLSIMMGVRLV